MDAHFLLWIAPLPHNSTRVGDWHPCISLSHYPISPVASPQCIARSTYYFGGSEVYYVVVITPIWDSQITPDHLTQARATLWPVRPSGRPPNNVAMYAYIPSPLTKNAVTRANTK